MYGCYGKGIIYYLPSTAQAERIRGNTLSFFSEQNAALVRVRTQPAKVEFFLQSNK